jgi:hypothetical protein
LSHSQATSRLVPTLTEVLDASDLPSPERSRDQVFQLQQLFESSASDGLVLDKPSPAPPEHPEELDLELDLAFDPNGKSVSDDGLKQAVLAAVDTALAEFRLQLLAKLEPLFENKAPPRSS